MKQIDRHWLRTFGLESIQHMTNTFSDAVVFIVDNTQTILFWSKGAEQLLGFTAEEMTGQHCLNGIKYQDCINTCTIKQSPMGDNIPFTVLTKDGRALDFRKHTQSFYDANGQFSGGIEILIPERNNSTPFKYIGIEFHEMRTQSDAMRRLFKQVQSVAKTDAPVLARGESGTGKELLAKAVHLESMRSTQPFIAVNCSAISENLIESELFGHAKGAFTGAYKERKGLFEQAHKGSLFLDEIAELPLAVQAKLLRVLDTQTFKRVGDNREIHVDVRIITATHRSLRKSVLDGKFRQDLMYRLRVVPLFIPPLRERPKDIELLLQHFINLGNAKYDHQIARISTAAKEVLLHHTWPGNVREIRNVIDFAFATGCTHTLSLEYLPPEFSEVIPNYRDQIPNSPVEVSLNSLTSTVPHSTSPNMFSERERILHALQQCNYHIGKTSSLLGLSRVTLWRKRKSYDI